MLWRYWYTFSLLLLIYTLLVLDDEAYSVYYDHVRETNKSESLQATFCFPLDSVLQLMQEEVRMAIQRNKTVFVPLLLSLAADSLNRHLNESLNGNLNRSLNENLNGNLNGTLSLVNLNHSYYANNHTCFVFRNADLRAVDYFQWIDFKVFPFEPETRPLFFEMVFSHKKNNLNFHDLAVEKVEVRLKRNKHRRCEEDPRMENGKPFTFHECLNSCLKRSASKAIYLYDQTESSFVNISDGRRDVAQELQCIRSSCNRSSCLMISHNSFHYHDHNDSEPRMIRILFKYDATYSIEGLDYYLQLIGVIALFLNVSLLQLTLRFFAVATRTIHSALHIQRIPLGQLMNAARWLVVVASFSLLCFLGVLIGTRFYQDLKNPIASHYYSIEPKRLPISIVLCAPIQLLISNATAEPSGAIEEAILESHSFGMIQNLTDDGLAKMLESPILVSVFESMERHLDYEVSKLVLFANDTYELDQPTVLLERCFRIEFDLDETAFEYYMLSTEIILQTQPRFRVQLHPVVKGQKFLKTSGTFKYKPRSTIHFYVTKLTVNCTNYPVDRPDLECTGRGDCLEKCIVANFLSNHSSLTTRALIEREQVARMRSDYNDLQFNRTSDLQIEEDCRRQFHEADCDEQRFWESHGYGHRKPGEYRVNLYSVLVYNLQSSDSFEKLVLNFLNILSIIYGVSIKKILNFVLSFGGFRSRRKRLCERFVLFAILAGFAYNVFVVFYQVVNERQEASGTFEQPDTIQLPDIVFCLNLRDIVPSYQEATEHHQVTGRYLMDELTSNYTLDRILAKLIYLNKKGEFAEFKGEFKSESNGEPDDQVRLFEFQSYLFLNLRCWQVSIRITYHLGHFFYINDTYLVKFYLNRTQLPRYFYLAYKYPQAKEFIRLFKYASGERVNRKMKFENFKQTEVEKFRFLKHPVAWFYERLYGMSEIATITDYLNKLKSDFRRRHNRTTRQIVLEQEQFECEINERLFHQYYLQVQQPIDERAMPWPLATYTAYESNIIEQHFDQNATLPDFEIFSNLFLFHTILSNENNFIKFVQDLLNAASFSLGVCILDLHVYLGKLIQLVPVVLYARLQRCRSALTGNLRL